MELPKISMARATKRGPVSTRGRRRGGLTLIEVLISVALLSAVGGFSLYMSMDDTRSYTFRDDRDRIVSVLQRARSQSMHSVCREENCESALPHGVYRNGQELILFEGVSYAARDEQFDEHIGLHSGAIALEGFSEAVFAPISGTVTVAPVGELSLAVSDGMGRKSEITLNAEGRIFWSN